ncbi:unnamed protein product [Albugo candida]|nr:unnamed protein product [Albugo candida]|eukprot:CCI10809.1 unnamed protein product [Albugo candida]
MGKEWNRRRGTRYFGTTVYFILAVYLTVSTNGDNIGTKREYTAKPHRVLEKQSGVQDKENVTQVVKPVPKPKEKHAGSISDTKSNKLQYTQDESIHDKLSIPTTAQQASPVTKAPHSNASAVEKSPSKKPLSAPSPLTPAAPPNPTPLSPMIQNEAKPNDGPSTKVKGVRPSNTPTKSSNTHHEAPTESPPATITPKGLTPKQNAPNEQPGQATSNQDGKTSPSPLSPQTPPPPQTPPLPPTPPPSPPPPTPPPPQTPPPLPPPPQVLPPPVAESQKEVTEEQNEVVSHPPDTDPSKNQSVGLLDLQPIPHTQTKLVDTASNQQAKTGSGFRSQGISTLFITLIILGISVVILGIVFYVRIRRTQWDSKHNSDLEGRTKAGLFSRPRDGTDVVSDKSADQTYAKNTSNREHRASDPFVTDSCYQTPNQDRHTPTFSIISDVSKNDAHKYHSKHSTVSMNSNDMNRQSESSEFTGESVYRGESEFTGDSIFEGESEFTGDSEFTGEGDLVDHITIGDSEFGVGSDFTGSIDFQEHYEFTQKSAHYNSTRFDSVFSAQSQPQSSISNNVSAIPSSMKQTMDKHSSNAERNVSAFNKSDRSTTRLVSSSTSPLSRFVNKGGSVFSPSAFEEDARMSREYSMSEERVDGLSWSSNITSLHPSLTGPDLEDVSKPSETTPREDESNITLAEYVARGKNSQAKHNVQQNSTDAQLDVSGISCFTVGDDDSEMYRLSDFEE